METQEETGEDIKDSQVSLEEQEETHEGIEDSRESVGGQEETGEGMEDRQVKEKKLQNKRESVQVIERWRKKCWKGVILRWETRTSF